MKCESLIYILAKTMFVYFGASVIYLIITRFMDTPFEKSLSYDQKNIKRDSSRQRSVVFLTGIIVSMAVLFIFKPFEKCSE